jgi:hypothetical protein
MSSATSGRRGGVAGEPPGPSWKSVQRVRLRRHWPWLLVVAVVAAGLVAMALGHWRRGLFVIGCGGVVAAGLRATMPARRVQLLVVRSRPLDVAALIALGGAIVILSLAIPAIRS